MSTDRAGRSLLGCCPGLLLSRRRSGGPAELPRGVGAGFGLLLRRFRMTLPPSPFYVGLDAAGLVSVWFLFGWFDGVIWGAMVLYSILLPAELSRRAPAVRFSRARVVIMQGRGL